MMELSVKTLKHVDVITVSGRIDSATTPEFETALKALQERGRHKLVLQLKDLEYISSNGLRAMVASLKVTRSHSGDLVLLQPSDRVRDTLGLVGFQSLFNTYDDVLDAIDTF
jgi:anti-sigma B factor antagonist